MPVRSPCRGPWDGPSLASLLSTGESFACAAISPLPAVAAAFRDGGQARAVFLALRAPIGSHNRPGRSQARPARQAAPHDPACARATVLERNLMSAQMDPDTDSFARPNHKESAAPPPQRDGRREPAGGVFESPSFFAALPAFGRPDILPLCRTPAKDMKKSSNAWTANTPGA